MKLLQGDVCWPEKNISFSPPPSRILCWDQYGIIRLESETIINTVLLTPVPASAPPNKFLLRFFYTWDEDVKMGHEPCYR